MSGEHSVTVIPRQRSAPEYQHEEAEDPFALLDDMSLLKVPSKLRSSKTSAPAKGAPAQKLPAALLAISQDVPREAAIEALSLQDSEPGRSKSQHRLDPGQPWSAAHGHQSTIRNKPMQSDPDTSAGHLLRSCSGANNDGQGGVEEESAAPAECWPDGSSIGEDENDACLLVFCDDLDDAAEPEPCNQTSADAQIALQRQQQHGSNHICHALADAELLFNRQQHPQSLHGSGHNRAAAQMPFQRQRHRQQQPQDHDIAAAREAEQSSDLPSPTPEAAQASLHHQWPQLDQQQQSGLQERPGRDAASELQQRSAGRPQAKTDAQLVPRLSFDAGGEDQGPADSGTECSNDDHMLEQDQEGCVLTFQDDDMGAEAFAAQHEPVWRAPLAPTDMMAALVGADGSACPEQQQAPNAQAIRCPPGRMRPTNPGATLSHTQICVAPDIILLYGPGNSF